MSTLTIKNTLPALLSKAVSAADAEADEIPWSPLTKGTLDSMPDARQELEDALDQLVAMEPTDKKSPLSSVTLDAANKFVQRGSGCTSTRVTRQALSQLVTELRKPPHAPLPTNTINVIRYLTPPAAKVAFDDMVIRRDRSDNHPLVFRYIVVKETQPDGSVKRVPVLRCVATPSHTLENGDLRAVLLALKVLAENGYGEDRYFLDGAKMRVIWGWDRCQVAIHFPAGEDGMGGAVVSLTLSETKASSWYTSVGVLVRGHFVNYSGLSHLTGRHVGTQVGNKMIGAMKEARSSAEMVREAAEMASRVQLYKDAEGFITTEPDGERANCTMVRDAITAMDNTALPGDLLEKLPKTFSALDLITAMIAYDTKSVETSERLQKGADSIIDFCYSAFQRQQAAA